MGGYPPITAYSLTIRSNGALNIEKYILEAFHAFLQQFIPISLN